MKETVTASNEADRAKAELADALRRAGIPHEEITVFGVLRTNVHITCRGRDAAIKWCNLLRQVFPDNPAVMRATTWPAKANKGTCLRPTTIRGYLVAVTGA